MIEETYSSQIGSYAPNLLTLASSYINILMNISAKSVILQIFGFPWCSTREELSIDVSITNVGLILTKQS